MKAPLELAGSVVLASFEHYQRGNKLHAIDAITGELLWDSKEYRHSFPLQTGDGVVYIDSWVDEVYYVHALSASTGEPLWRTDVAREIEEPPTVADGVEFVGIRDNSVYALNPANGELSWLFQLDNRVWYPLVQLDGAVYFHAEDRHVYALDATNGELRWRFSADDYVYWPPAFADGTVYVRSRDRYLYALTRSAVKSAGAFNQTTWQACGQELQMGWFMLALTISNSMR